MRIIPHLMLGFVLGLGIYQVGNAKCKSGYEKVSCSEVEGAKRKGFCWKGTPPEKKIQKICKKNKKRKKVRS